MNDIVFWTAFITELIVFGLFAVSKVQNARTGFSTISFWVRSHTTILYLVCLALFLFCRLYLKVEAAWVWVLLILFFLFFVSLDTEIEAENLRDYLICTHAIPVENTTDNHTEQLQHLTEILKKRGVIR